MKKLSLSLFLLVLAISVSAFATGKHRYKLHNWWQNDEITSAAGITGQQISKMNAISMSYTDKFKALRTEKKALKERLYDLMGDPKATDEAITAKHGELIAKKVEYKELKLEMKLKMRALLDDDQIVKLSEILKEKWEAKKAGKECSYKDGKECAYKKGKEDCPYKDKK